MTDAKPNAIEMLKLLPDVDAFVLEVSRVVSPQPWKHEPGDAIQALCQCHVCAEVGWTCIRCKQPNTGTCPVPPRLTESPEWWAFKLRDEVMTYWHSDRFKEPAVAISGSLETKWSDSGYWFAYHATPQEQIAVALVAMGKWRLP